MINNLPKIKREDNQEDDKKKPLTDIASLSKSKPSQYDYFGTKISKYVVESLLKIEKDDRFSYFLKFGILRRFEGEGDIIFVEIPQIPKKIVVYRKPMYRIKTFDRLYLNNLDLPHIPLFEGEENLKLLSLENNLINKIDHLVSLNNLLYLNLYSNKIVEIENLHTVPKLRALMLGKNLIEKIKNLNFLTDLEVLDLHSNKIKIIENLSVLKKLRLLNLANNQITGFADLLSNRSLEELNLRKNLIVTVPPQISNFDKLRKLNLGRNMISKVENLVELKKLKYIVELIIEDNPVLSMKEANDIIKFLPIKTKSKDKKSDKDLKIPEKAESTNTIKQVNNVNIQLPQQKPFHNTLSKSLTLKSNKIDEKSSTGDSDAKKLSTMYNNLEGFNGSSSNNPPNFHDNDLAQSILDIKTKTSFNPNLDSGQLGSQTMLPNQLGPLNNAHLKEERPLHNSEYKPIDESSDNILKHIENEWLEEIKFIKDNGFNGFSIKKLKETKIVSGHAELEGVNKLNIFGNALEVLDQREFYDTIIDIHFEYFNIDLISNKKVLEKIKNFTKLAKISFSNNNLHSFYQIIKFEDLGEISNIIIKNNEICSSNLLKYFLLYRFQNLKFFNGEEICQKDISVAKKLFEYFDKCISMNENRNKEEAQSKKHGEEKAENTIDLHNYQEMCYDFVKENLVETIENIIDFEE